MNIKEEMFLNIIKREKMLSEALLEKFIVAIEMGFGTEYERNNLLCKVAKGDKQEAEKLIKELEAHLPTIASLLKKAAETLSKSDFDSLKTLFPFMKKRLPIKSISGFLTSYIADPSETMQMIASKIVK